MNHQRWMSCIALLLALLLAAPADAQRQNDPIPAPVIAELQTKLGEAGQSASSARKRLAYNRIIRETGSLLEKHPDAPNRFEVLGVRFRSQQSLLGVDNSTTNRRAFLETARQLAAAPDEYASLRLDADLLLSQAEIARQGGDLRARADALKPLVDRYRGTEVEVKAVRIALLMAIEFGDAGLIQHLRHVIAERMPGNMEMINFQRDQLAGQVFGAPFVGRFEGSDGRLYRFPMDGMGKTTALYFWTKEGDGLEQLKKIAEGWEKVKAEPGLNAMGRYQFISFNLDGLPDAGESLLRKAGLDWPAMHLRGGEDNEIYKTYVRNTPKLLTMTPSGYTAMVMSGATRVRPDRGWDGALRSGLARSWSRQTYASWFQSVLAGDFLIIDPTGVFDPAAPPEWQAAAGSRPDDEQKLTRDANSVPEDKLRAIQACFAVGPRRYQLTHEDVRANYAKAEALCRQAIADHPDANDLWVVRNRRIVALMGLWKIDGDRKHFDAAIEQANAALEQGYPEGTDLVARFCLAREALRVQETDPARVVNQFAESGGETKATTTYAAASVLALEIGERQLHEAYRRASLDKHADHPVLWLATSFLMDRYQRYWMYHPPFTAGWTYGRRMGHFLAIGTPEDANRSLQLELKTLDGEPVRLPDASDGKWTVIEFRSKIDKAPHVDRYGTFAQMRPFDDVAFVSAALTDDTVAVKEVIAQKKREDVTPTMLVPGGINHPIVQQLGILDHDTRPNIAVVRPDGTIAAFLSGLAMSSQHGNALQNIIEHHDEQAIEEALARNDLEEAKRLAFAYAPTEQVAPPDAPRNWKPKKLTVPHLRARAKVFMAMGEWEKALTDAEVVYLEIKKKAGWLSMRTDDLDEAERLKATIADRLKQADVKQ
ncbi:MAG: hypothetical protein AAGI37_09950 [Planctomycetota bacterium]